MPRAAWGTLPTWPLPGVAPSQSVPSPDSPSAAAQLNCRPAAKQCYLPQQLPRREDWQARASPSPEVIGLRHYSQLWVARTQLGPARLGARRTGHIASPLSGSKLVDVIADEMQSGRSEDLVSCSGYTATSGPQVLAGRAGSG